MSKNWHQTHTDQSSFTQKIADKVSSFVGSWSFLLLHVIWFTLWIVFNVESFPYGLLTMIVSLEAILLSTIIMISQTRAGDRDRIQAQHDYVVNEEAKREIEELQVVIGRIEAEHIAALDKKLEKVLVSIKRLK